MEMLFKRMEANNVAFVILNSSNRWLGIALVGESSFFFFNLKLYMIFLVCFFPTIQFFKGNCDIQKMIISKHHERLLKASMRCIFKFFILFYSLFSSS
jgi:hypothetical protein